MSGTLFGVRIVETDTVVDFPFKSEEDAQAMIEDKCIFKSMYEPVEITEENASEFKILPITGMRDLT